MEKEVRKLLKARFIKKIKYHTCLANIVMVNKSSRKWRMCVCFTNLKKVYAQYPYRLPSIDMLINYASSFKELSFINSYSRCNSIRMSPNDSPKTTFTTLQNNYYYDVMPFGLKIVEET